MEPVAEAATDAAGLRGQVQSVPHACQGPLVVTEGSPLVGQNDGVERVPVCSDEDRAILILLSKADDLSRTIHLDATRMQEDARPWRPRFVFVEYSMYVPCRHFNDHFTRRARAFFGGFIAIAAQLGEAFIARLDRRFTDHF